MILDMVMTIPPTYPTAFDTRQFLGVLCTACEWTRGFNHVSGNPDLVLQ